MPGEGSRRPHCRRSDMASACPVVQCQLSADEAATAPLALGPLNVVTCAMIVVWSATAGTIVYHCAGAPMLKLAPAVTAGAIDGGRLVEQRVVGIGRDHRRAIIIIIMSMSSMFMLGSGTTRKATSYRYDAPGGRSTLASTVDVAVPAVQVLARLEDAETS